MKHALSKRQRAVLEVMSKPKTPAELREQIGLKRNNNISPALRKLLELKLIFCLNLCAVNGRLYGLTKKGKCRRRQLMEKNEKPYFYNHPRNLNWNLYGKIVIGRQRKAVLRVMATSMSLKCIRERAKEHNRKISRTNVNDILQFFVQQHIARKIKNKTRIIFSLTKNGELIRTQLIQL